MNTIWRLLLVGLPALLAGCGGEPKGPEPPPASSSAPASPRGPVRTAAAPAPTVVIREGGDMNATLQQLTRALRDYVVRTRSVPKNFEEFAAKSQVRFPLPPAGKKYAIEKQEVVLVKR